MSPNLIDLKTPTASTIPTQKASINHSVFDALPDSGYVRESQLVLKWTPNLRQQFKWDTVERNG